MGVGFYVANVCLDQIEEKAGSSAQVSLIPVFPISICVFFIQLHIIIQSYI